MSLNNSTAPLGQRKPEGMGTGEDVTSSSLRPQKMCGQPCRFPQSCSTKQGCSLNTSTHPPKKKKWSQMLSRRMFLSRVNCF